MQHLISIQNYIKLWQVKVAESVMFITAKNRIFTATGHFWGAKHNAYVSGLPDVNLP